MSTAAVLESHYTLLQLTRMSPAALDRVYADGALPVLSSLSGVPHGRMLALDGPLGRGRPAVWIRRLASQRGFPWRGKAFAHQSADHGTGINRIRLLGEREWYPFQTSVAPSVVDGRPCVLLDYDLDENPWFIRRIRDELREVSPGLFLGPALARFRGAHHRVLHFAVDHNSPAT